MKTRWVTVNHKCVGFNGYSDSRVFEHIVTSTNLVEKYDAVYLNFIYPVKIRNGQTSSDAYLYHIKLDVTSGDTGIVGDMYMDGLVYHSLEYIFHIELFQDEIDLSTVSETNNPDGTGVVLARPPILYQNSTDGPITQAHIRHDFQAQQIHIPIAITYEDSYNVTEDTLFKAAKIKLVETKHSTMLYTSFNYQLYLEPIIGYERFQQIPAEIPIVF